MIYPIKSNPSRLKMALFDSGPGGISVLKELRKSFKNCAVDFHYLGDTAKSPYGNRSPAEIKALSSRIIRHLANEGANYIIIACNTASIQISPIKNLIEEKIKVHIKDIVGYGLSEAVSATKTGAIGILGTETTIESRFHEDAILSLNDKIIVFGQPCQRWVGLVNDGDVDSVKAREYVKEDILALLSKKKKTNKKTFYGRDIDTFFLACTHFPFLYHTIEAVTKSPEIGKEFNLIDPARSFAETTFSSLLNLGVLREGKTRFFFSFTEKLNSEVYLMVQNFLGLKFRPHTIRLKEEIWEGILTNWNKWWKIKI